jgi:hypothetical protein
MYDLQGDYNTAIITSSKFTFNHITRPYIASDDYNLNNFEFFGYTIYPTKYIQIPVEVIFK